ncbi:MAG TPA: transcription-repair coupling factor [Clostridiaceae bacterium]|nr:transcription-repair coupling factor [Clostridiaceae bacterium]
MDYLFEPLLEICEYNKILDSIRNGIMPLNITGPADSQKAHISSAVCRHLERRGLFVAFNEMQARRMYEDISYFLGEGVLYFPSKEVIFHDIEAKSNDAVYERLEVLNRLIEGKYRFVVTSAEAVSQKLMPKALYMKNSISLSVGSRVDIQNLSVKLVSAGYERVSIVEGKGQFAVRGGIIDIFSVDSEHAVRMELFDDEVDSIRIFDVMTQRSVDRLDSIHIIPAREVIFSQDMLENIICEIERDLASFEGSNADSEQKQKILSDIERLKNDSNFPGIDRYIPYIINDPYYIFDYLTDDTIVFVDELSRLRQRVDNLVLEHHELCKALIEKGQLLPRCEQIYFDSENIERKLKRCKTIYMSALAPETSVREYSEIFNVPSRSISPMRGHLEFLKESVRRWKENGSRVIILSGTKGRGERLVDTLRAEGIESSFLTDGDTPMQRGQVVIMKGSLSRGFEYPSIGFVIISDNEVLGQDKRTRKAAKKIKGREINLFTDLVQGDYVVHQTHGIGQYVGIESLVVDGVKRDYLKIRYQDNGFLYIPTNQLDLIQKYIGSEGKTPKLSKLGGTDWIKTKKKVKESLKELADELIRLYAQRQSIKGFTYSKDTIWQKQFEEQFPYEETEDQLRCIEEIKRDMESGKVMDRLLCGDVGYGKTEVAMRAAFKAVMDGRQVAYLVPTTVLANQHYHNFLERMRDFPVKVEMISRFRSRAEQKKILKDVKSGAVDILIGTHRLLQKDIHFKNLGLLIIDEEQRFGVEHKERIKNMAPDVDVLTLTATPIPRTLHMSLVGIRDISVLEDPPEERYPVQTYVMEYNEDVIRDALIRELSRGGQAFYLFNRVRSIELKVSQIQALVPDARIAVAHGQMEERQLENIMQDFINGEYDILVCTTIIESGLDMPNVNTIIVEDADRMGLAQLYQLRGRVGRSNRLAYAYITYRKDKVVSEIAQKRLQAIKDFTEFGSGFKIAMRDMEIRGAGNLLGPEQHGNMESVGYDMYCKLLDETIRELKGEPVSQDDVEVTIDINVDAYIDREYIDNESEKIEMYKKIASIQDEQDIVDIEDELVDRYGDIPQPVRNLIMVACIKALAKSAGFSSITEKSEAVILQYVDMKRVNIEAIGKLMSKYRRQLLFNAGSSPYLMYRISGIKRDKLLDNIKILLQDMKSFEVH